jgi:hypothetical protein
VTIDEVINFSDTNVFEDATPYPMILLFANHSPSSNSTFNTCFVDSSVENKDSPIEHLFENTGGDGKFCISYDITQSRLGSEIWRFVPDALSEVTENVLTRATHTVEDIGDVVTGVRAGFNDAFIVDNSVIEENSIESEVVKECLKAKDTERYHIPETDRRIIYTPLLDPETHENAFDWIAQFEGDLNDREQFKGRDDMEWWEIEQPVSPDTFEREKLITPAFSKRNSFAYDSRNLYHVDMVMSVVFDDSYDSEEYLYHVLGVLNSKAVEIVFKQSATLIQGKYYRYYQQQIRPLPVVIPDQICGSEITKITRKLVEHRRITENIQNFPQPYIEQVDCDLEYIEYNWQTRRYPVDASVQETTDGRFAVTAGRTDEITDPVMDRGDREERKLRAKYVHAAVDGRNMKKGEEQTIRIPQSPGVIEELIEVLESDRQTIKETNIKDLEAEIDRAVYDLFDLTEDERSIVEDYLEVF